MPMSKDFYNRLSPVLPDIAGHFCTPFHIYDEKGMRETGRQMIQAFSNLKCFREFFAVKALPNPQVMTIMKDMGFGFDCSSIVELMLARDIGCGPDDIMFTSNNTGKTEFQAAFSDNGCIVNLDDISLIDKLDSMPELISFRYNPGPRRKGNSIIGNPVESKYGVSHDQILDAYTMSQKKGASRFGLHTMLVSNELNHEYMAETAKMLLDLAGMISDRLGIRFEFLNIGGGLGIPYTPDEKPFDLTAMGREITAAFRSFESARGWVPGLFLESGRYMTGPHGVLVTSVINHKSTYRKYTGVDASMSSLMRPGMYGAYHHIHVHGKTLSGSCEKVDIVGSLCENIDKFAIQRQLPETSEGDLVVIHDTGAHGHSMGFNYNGHLRPKELMLRMDGSVDLIRREESPADYFATLNFTPDSLIL